MAASEGAHLTEEQGPLAHVAVAKTVEPYSLIGNETTNRGKRLISPIGDIYIYIYS